MFNFSQTQEYSHIYSNITDKVKSQQKLKKNKTIYKWKHKLSNLFFTHTSHVKPRHQPHKETKKKVHFLCTIETDS